MGQRFGPLSQEVKDLEEIVLKLFTSVLPTGVLAVPGLKDPEDKYLEFDLFADDRNINIREQSSKIVKTRKDHVCTSPIGLKHTIPKGCHTRYEKAIIDEEWAYYWTCLDCIDEYEDQIPIDEDEFSLEEYEDDVLRLAVYPNIGSNFVYPALGLAGEAGEVADKVKRILRDKKGVVSNDDRLAILRELGDVLWYVIAEARELDSNLHEVAMLNHEKLLDRNKRGKIHGGGDNR